ncbi:MAG: hypothetical protein MUO26_04300 [Methanotrichaceae archaeon]|nr:hypothetical protein [Methanotrichaceae archaeon]
MVRCDEFYEKWKGAPNFCDKSPTTVDRIEKYLDLFLLVQEEVAKSEILNERPLPMGELLTERASRPILNMKDSEKQRKVVQQIVKRAVEQILDGKSSPIHVTTPEVIEIVHEVSPPAFSTPTTTPAASVYDEFRKANKNLKEVKSLSGKTLLNLMITVQKTWKLLKDLERRTPLPKTKVEPATLPVRWEIEAEHLKTFLESVLVLESDIRVRFHEKGMVVNAGESAVPNFVVSAFLPKELFTKYDPEPLEIGWFDARNSFLSKILSGSVGKLQLSVQPDGSFLYMVYAVDERRKEVPLRLIPRSLLREMTSETMPSLEPASKIVVPSKEFIDTLRSLTKLKPDRWAKFSISEDKLNLVISAEKLDVFDVEYKVPITEMVQDGPADSYYSIEKLMSIQKTILRSDTVALGLGEPLTIDCQIGQIIINYVLAQGKAAYRLT